MASSSHQIAPFLMFAEKAETGEGTSAFLLPMGALRRAAEPAKLRMSERVCLKLGELIG